MQNIETAYGVVVAPDLLRQCVSGAASIQEVMVNGEHLPSKVELMEDRRLLRGHQEFIPDAEAWRARWHEQQQWEKENAPKDGEIVWEGHPDRESILSISGITAHATRLDETDEWQVEVWGNYSSEVLFRSLDHVGKIIGGDLARAIGLSVARAQSSVSDLEYRLLEASAPAVTGR